MPTLEEVKQQLLEARQQTEQRKQEVSEAEYQLEKARTSLPQYQSQEAIRKLSREQRRGISQAVKSIEQKRAEIGEYGKEIKKFETEELSPSEYQVQKYEEETRALETASKLFEHKVPLDFVTGEEYKYLKDMYRQDRSAREDFQKYVEEYQKENPTEKLVIDWNKLQIKGIESGALGKSLSIEEYNKRVKELQKASPTLDIQKIIYNQSKLPTKLKDKGSISKMAEVVIQKPVIARGFGMVSAFTGKTIETGKKRLEPTKTFLITKIIEPTYKYVGMDKPMALTYPSYTTDSGEIRTGGTIVVPKREALDRLGVYTATSLLFMGAMSAPPSIVSKAIPLISKTEFSGVIESIGKGSKVTIIGKTDAMGTKQVWTTGKEIIIPTSEKVSVGIGVGKTFQIEQRLKIPSPIQLQKPTPYLKLKPTKEEVFISVSKLKELPPVKLVEKTKGIISKSEVPAKTYESKTTIFTLGGREKVKDIFLVRKVEGTKPYYSYVGGVPKTIYSKLGKRYILREPTIKGKLFIIPKETTGIKILKPSTINKTPLSKTFGKPQQLKEISKAEQKQIVGLISSMAKTGEKGLKLQKPISNYGKLGVVSGVYGGVYGGFSGGKYIRDSFSGSISGYSSVLTGKATAKIETFAQPITQGYELRTGQRTGIISISASGFRETQKLKEIELFKQPQREIQKEGLKEKEIQISLLSFKQILEIKQSQRQKITPTEIISGKPKQPSPKPPRTQKSTSILKSLISVISTGKKPEEFEIFQRTKGIDIKIGEEKSLFEATKKLKLGLKGGLEASGFIISKKTGEKVKAVELINLLGEEFAPSKKDIFRIIQKREKRLGTKSEVFKIKKARQRGFFK